MHKKNAKNYLMKSIFSILLASLFCSCSSADEVPIAIGMGSDTVWFKTGKDLVANANSVTVSEYGAIIFYAPDKTVESILLGLIDPSTTTKYTLHGVGINDNKKDIINKFGEPTKEFPKNKEEILDVYESVWVLKDQLLVVCFWRTDQVSPDKHIKDSVASVTLRKAHF